MLRMQVPTWTRIKRKNNQKTRLRRRQVRWHLFDLAGFLEITSHYPTPKEVPKRLVDEMSLNLQLDLRTNLLLFLGWTSNSTDYFQLALGPALNLTMLLHSWSWLWILQWLPSFSGLAMHPQTTYKHPPSLTMFLSLSFQYILYHRVLHQFHPTATTCWNLKGTGEVSFLTTCFSRGAFLTCSLELATPHFVFPLYPCKMCWINLFTWLFPLLKLLIADIKYLLTFYFPIVLYRAFMAHHKSSINAW